MKTIGFLDYYLDEWHANNYPAWIREASGGEMEVAYTHCLLPHPVTGMTGPEWCEQYGVQWVDSIEELVEKSDYLIVLSPDNCEMHEELCKLPLASGKRTYVDKTFAPDLPTARRIFAHAEAHGTPCYSTSALRFAEEYVNMNSSEITAVNSWGPMDFDTYSIHQLEPLVMLMGVPAEKVMYLEGEGWYLLNILFEDGRPASISGYRRGSPMMMNFACKTDNKLVKVESAFFQAFIRNLVAFFRTGVAPVCHEETLRIMALRGAGLEARKNPGQWVAVEQV